MSMAARTLVFSLCAGLLLAACSQRTVVGADDGTGLGGGVMRLGDTEVARVDSTPIYLSDVERAAASEGLIAAGTPLSLDDPVFRTTLDGLVDQRLLALDALRRGLDQDDEARRRLLAARERILGNYNVERRLSDDVTEEALRELYDAQAALAQTGPERRYRQIVVEDADTAQSVVERLADEEDFAELARELSVHNSADAGGAMGWSGQASLPATLRDAVFDTAVGSRTAPIATPDGWYVIEVLDARTPGAREFEDVRDDLARFLTFKTIEDALAELREGAEVSYQFGPAVANRAASETAE